MQILFYGVVIFIGWLLYRRFLKDAARVRDRTKHRNEENQTGAKGTLVRDPKTGEYRVEQDADQKTPEN